MYIMIAPLRRTCTHPAAWLLPLDVSHQIEPVSDCCDPTEYMYILGSHTFACFPPYHYVSPVELHLCS